MSDANFKLLFVEDEDLLRETLTDEFQDMAVEVLAASNGVEAIELLKMNQVDVVVSDMRMPDIDGATLRKLARAASLNETALWVVLTAHTDQNIEELQELGFDEVFFKPFRAKALYTFCLSKLNEKKKKAQLKKCV